MKLAIIGDMHMQFDEDDVRFFNGSDYGAILLVGDLSSKNPDSMFKLLPLLNQLTKPTYFIPGNHDTTGVRQLLGELMQNEFLINFGADSQDTRMQKLKAELTAPILCGYSSHSLAPGLGLVAARPFSMGNTNGMISLSMSSSSSASRAVVVLAESWPGWALASPSVASSPWVCASGTATTSWMAE